MRRRQRAVEFDAAPRLRRIVAGLRDPRGQTNSELILIAGILVLLILVVMATTGDGLRSAASTIAEKVRCAVTSGAGCGASDPSSSPAAAGGTSGAGPYGLVSTAAAPAAPSAGASASTTSSAGGPGPSGASSSWLPGFPGSTRGVGSVAMGGVGAAGPGLTDIVSAATGALSPANSGSTSAAAASAMGATPGSSTSATPSLSEADQRALQIQQIRDVITRQQGVISFIDAELAKPGTPDPNKLRPYATATGSRSAAYKASPPHIQRVIDRFEGRWGMNVYHALRLGWGFLPPNGGKAGLFRKQYEVERDRSQIFIEMLREEERRLLGTQPAPTYAPRQQYVR